MSDEQELAFWINYASSHYPSTVHDLLCELRERREADKSRRCDRCDFGDDCDFRERVERNTESGWCGDFTPRTDAARGREP